MSFRLGFDNQVVPLDGNTVHQNIPNKHHVVHYFGNVHTIRDEDGWNAQGLPNDECG